MGVRNRDAHRAPNAAQDAKRNHRDLDTVARLAESLDPDAPETATLMQASDAALSALAAPPEAPASQRATTSADGDLLPGMLVQLKARPDVRSPIMRIESGGKERSVVLFVDGKERRLLRVASGARGNAVDLGPHPRGDASRSDGDRAIAPDLEPPVLVQQRTHRLRAVPVPAGHEADRSGPPAAPDR